MARIEVLCPTRGKPDECRRLINEILLTSEDAHISFYVADDDPQLKQYRSICTGNLSRVHMYIGPLIGFSNAINFLAGRRTEDQMNLPSLLLRCEDDFYFYAGWETAYIAAIPADGIRMIWCNYVHKGPNAEPQTAAITYKWYKTLGYFSLPGIYHFFCDNALMDLAVGAEAAVYIPTSYIHHKWNPADPRKEHHPSWTQDEARYNSWRATQLQDDIKKLQSARDEK